MANHLYYVPREGRSNNTTVNDNCISVLENQVHPQRDRVWQGLATNIPEPFTPVKLDRNLSPRVYLGVDITIIDDPFSIDASALVSSRPRPVTTAKVTLVDDPLAIDIVTFIAR